MYAVFLYDATARIESGRKIIVINEIYTNMLGICALTDIAAANPKVTRKPRVIRLADFALGPVGKPSLNKPCTKKISPINMAKNDTACIPSKKVAAIPANESATPAIPNDVRPIPGSSKSQSAKRSHFYSKSFR